MSERKKILVVDDNPDVVESMTIVLESQGYEVIVAYGGKEGLAKLSEDPDLIILDVMMETETEGLQFAYKLRAPEGAYVAYREIPIIVVTSLHDNMSYRIDDRTGSEYLPVEEFIDKPVQPPQLLAAVQRLIG
jgi:CheY-like chemotaxis protein